MGFEQCLLRRSPIGTVKRTAAGHTAHTEQLQLLPRAIDIDISFVPVDLRLHTPVVALRHERLAFQKTQLPFPLADVLPHGRFGYRTFGFLFLNTTPHSVCRMTL